MRIFWLRFRRGSCSGTVHGEAGDEEAGRLLVRFVKEAAALSLALSLALALGIG